jgi:hypothetical protein
VRSSLSASVSEPQSLALVVCYALAATTLLGLWLRFLRSTTRSTTREEVVS